MRTRASGEPLCATPWSSQTPLLVAIRYVVELARDRRDRIGVGDGELDRREAGIGDAGHVAHGGVDLPGAAGEQRVRERLADPALGARDDRDGPCDLHEWPPSRRIWMTCSVSCFTQLRPATIAAC